MPRLPAVRAATWVADYSVVTMPADPLPAELLAFDRHLGTPVHISRAR